MQEGTSFNLIIAWWLAEVSTLVYADEEFVRPRFDRVGLTEVRYFDKLSTQCYVANNDKFAIVAFRGSEIWKKNRKFDLGKVMADLKADVDIWPINSFFRRLPYALVCALKSLIIPTTPG